MKTIYCVLSIGLIYFGISVFKSASVDRFDFLHNRRNDYFIRNILCDARC